MTSSSIIRRVPMCEVYQSVRLLIYFQADGLNSVGSRCHCLCTVYLRSIHGWGVMRLNATDCLIRTILQSFSGISHEFAICLRSMVRESPHLLCKASGALADRTSVDSIAIRVNLTLPLLKSSLPVNAAQARNPSPIRERRQRK